jgi:antitoxin MazE
MPTKVQRWGNSQGVRIPKSALESAHLGIGDEVVVSVRDGMIVISPARRVRGGVRLADLCRRMPRGRRFSELDWGAPTGKEVW